MTEEKPDETIVKLKVDKKKRFHLKLPDGKEQIIELTDKEIETCNNWFVLLSKHDIRFEIEAIVQIFNELNLTEISHLVKQSKSTVDRHLKSMEKDGLLVSHTGVANDKGRIAPRLYQLNKKLYTIRQNSEHIWLPRPTEPKKIIEYYQREIDGCRSIINLFIFLLKMMDPLLNLFENQLNDINEATKIYDDYFNAKTANTWPIFGYTYISEKYWDKCNKATLEYAKKMQEIFTLQNTDPEAKEREILYCTTILPIKALFKVYKREILDKK